MSFVSTNGRERATRGNVSSQLREVRQGGGRHPEYPMCKCLAYTAVPSANQTLDQGKYTRTATRKTCAQCNIEVLKGLGQRLVYANKGKDPSAEMRF